MNDAKEIVRYTTISGICKVGGARVVQEKAGTPAQKTITEKTKKNTFLGGPIRVRTGGHRGNDPLKNVRRVDADWILAEALRAMPDRRISRMSQAFCVDSTSVDSTSGEGRDWR